VSGCAATVAASNVMTRSVRNKVYPFSRARGGVIYCRVPQAGEYYSSLVLRTAPMAELLLPTITYQANLFVALNRLWDSSIANKNLLSADVPEQVT